MKNMLSHPDMFDKACDVQKMFLLHLQQSSTEEEEEGQHLIKDAYKVTISMAETKGMTITEPDDEYDVSLKICYHSCKYKIKNILQKQFGGKEYMHDFFVQTVVIKDSDDSKYDNETYVPGELEKEEEEVGVFEDWAAKIEQCRKVKNVMIL